MESLMTQGFPATAEKRVLADHTSGEVIRELSFHGGGGTACKNIFRGRMCSVTSATDL